MKLAGHVRRNLVAYLALLFALSGTSVAATNALLPRNSVGSAQVRDYSLLKRDFKSGQVARGPRGPAGSEGRRGPTGASATLEGVEAGGDLTGSYPNPEIGMGKVGWSELSPEIRTGIFRDLQRRTWFLLDFYGSFTNGWHNLGGEYAAAAYGHNAEGDVVLKGVIAGGAVPSDAFSINCAAPDDKKTHVFATVSGRSLAKVEVRASDTPCLSACPAMVGAPCPPETRKDAIVSVTYGSNTAVTLDGISWHTGELVETP